MKKSMILSIGIPDEPHTRSFCGDNLVRSIKAAKKYGDSFVTDMTEMLKKNGYVPGDINSFRSEWDWLLCAIKPELIILCSKSYMDGRVIESILDKMMIKQLDFLIELIIIGLKK